MQSRARTFGVTLPTSTKPNPIIMNCLAASACLSHPAARPRGLLNSRPKTAADARRCVVTCHSRAMVGGRLKLLLQQQQKQLIGGHSSGSEQEATQKAMAWTAAEHAERTCRCEQLVVLAIIVGDQAVLGRLQSAARSSAVAQAAAICRTAGRRG